MERLKRDFIRIILAQVAAFGLSWLAINYVFIGPIPRVRPNLKEDVLQTPAKVYAATKQAAYSLAHIASSQVYKSAQLPPGTQQKIQLPPPWIGESVPEPTSVSGQTPTHTPASTSSLPFPSLFQRRETPTQEPTGRPTAVPTQPPRPTATNTPVPEPTEIVTLTQMEQAILDEVNRRRVAAGIGKLNAQSNLTKAARSQANHLNSNGICPPTHTGEGGSGPYKRIKETGYRGVALGETVLCGGRTAQIAVDMWWSSTAHRLILTDRSATQAGVGWVDGYATVDTGR